MILEDYIILGMIAIVLMYMGYGTYSEIKMKEKRLYLIESHCIQYIDNKPKEIIIKFDNTKIKGGF